MSIEQAVLDFDQVADTIILIALDGREVEVPRRDLVAVPGSKHRYLRPESLLEPAPRCVTPPPRRTPPYRSAKP